MMTDAKSKRDFVNTQNYVLLDQQASHPIGCPDCVIDLRCDVWWPCEAHFPKGAS